MSYADKLFKEEVNNILENGFNDQYYDVRPHWEDGTAAHTIKTFGIMRRYDLSKEFPILTLRTQYFKTAVKEMLWMWRDKSNNIKDLDAHIWDSWADETGSIGKTYSYQLAKKYNLPEGNNMDQVDALIYNLKTNPMNRRMIVTMWNPADLKEMSLAPCVYETIWDVTGDKLNMTLIQRSGDCIAAAASGGMDTVEYAVLLYAMAQACGYKPGIFCHYVNNLHIYDRHISIAKEIMNNPEYDAPTLWVNPDVHDFYEFKLDDFKLINYQSTKYAGKIEVAI